MNSSGVKNPCYNIPYSPIKSRTKHLPHIYRRHLPPSIKYSHQSHTKPICDIYSLWINKYYAGSFWFPHIYILHCIITTISRNVNSILHLSAYFSAANDLWIAAHTFSLCKYIQTFSSFYVPSVAVIPLATYIIRHLKVRKPLSVYIN